MRGRGQTIESTRLMGGERNALETRMIRMEIAAEKLMENVLKRRRWTAADRDAVAHFLFRLTAEENKKEREGKEK